MRHVQSESYTPDADGNLTSDSRWVYKWDAENRLARVETQVSAAAVGVPPKRIQNTYDYSSRLIRRQVFSGTYGAGVITWSSSPDAALDANLLFLYDGMECIAALKPDQTLFQAYVWGLDLSGTLHGAGGVGGLVMFRRAVGTSTETYFPTYDGNGNVTGLVKGEDAGLANSAGTAVARYEYGPFGQLLRISGEPVALDNPFRFSTKWQDGQSDLLYYGFRYYAPSTGKWLSRDPIGEEGGLNLYAFTENSPVDFYDVLGLWTGGDHETLTGDSFTKAGVSSALGTCANPVLAWLKHWNLQQDEGAAFQENRRHFNRNIDKPTGSTAAKMRGDYSAYLVEELGRFNKKLGSASPSLQDCKDALESLGRLTHSWQDYYAHAIILVKAKADKTLWTRKPPITDSPDNPAGTGGQIVPSSWNNWHDSGEHGWSEVGGAEGDARKADARQFVTGKYKGLIPQWAVKCKCYCDKLGSP